MSTRKFAKFDIIRPLGAGGMGSVYLAHDPQLDREVALKVMAPHVAQDDSFRERFRREAAILAKMESPHIVTIFDHGEDEGSLWIATQVISGGDLGQLLRENGPMPPRIALDVVAQVAEGLDDAHAVGVLHRDVKAANVLLRGPASGGRQHAYLCDFGIATDQESTLTRTRAVAGTWAYMSPERGAGGPASQASDIYAVGCLLWACLSGQAPYSGSDLEMAMAHRAAPIPQLTATDPLSRGLNSVLNRAMAKDPGARYPSARALRDDLRLLLDGGQVTVTPPQPPPAPESWDSPPTPSTPQGPSTAKTPGPAPTALGGAAPRPRRTGVIAVAVLAVLTVIVGGVVGGLALNRDDASVGPQSPVGPTQPSPEPTDPGVTGDLTGDGRGDLIIAETDGGVEDDYDDDRTWLTVYSGGTDNKFTRVKKIDTHSAVGDVLNSDRDQFMVSGDVDGDGVLELVNRDFDDIVRVYSAVTGETKEYTVPANGQPDVFNLAMGDADGDGRQDLMFVPSRGVNERFQVWVAHNNGDGFDPYEKWYDVPHVPTMRALLIGDYDGDGDDDIAYSDNVTSDITLLTADSGKYTSQGPLPNQRQSFSIASGDFDGDGTDELMIADYGAHVLKLQDRAWAETTWLADPNDRYNVDAANPALYPSDVDGDGMDDLIQINDPTEGYSASTDEQKPGGKILVLKSDGTKFSPPTEVGTYACQCDPYYVPVMSYPTP